MKKILIFILVIALPLIIVSCMAHTEDELLDATFGYSSEVEKLSETESEIDIQRETETETEKLEETEINTEYVEQVNGGNNVCTVHHIDYHSFDQCLTHYVGYDLFKEWFNKTGIPVENSPNGCKYPESNIYEFIHYFDIPEDVLIKFYNELSIPDYNIDLLYNGTAEDNDLYYNYRSYSDACRIEEIKMDNFNELKYAIRLNNIDAFPKIMTFAEYSLIEMMLMTDTPLEFIYERIERKKATHGDGVYGSQYEYDFSLLDENNRSELEKCIEEHSAFYIDRIFCRLTPYETPYEKQVAENKALGYVFE